AIVVIRQRPVVARRGKIRDAVRDDRIDRLSDLTVLKEWLVEIAHVIDNHLGSGAAAGNRRRQLADAIGEIRLTVLSGIESKTRARFHIVDDLHNRTPFIAERQLGRRAVILAAGLFEHDYARRQVAW